MVDFTIEPYGNGLLLMGGGWLKEAFGAGQRGRENKNSIQNNGLRQAGWGNGSGVDFFYFHTLPTPGWGF
ncbi:MAG: hypothetical protein D6785_13615 [Planctomycetota bacterium]|nr:MAG: hypothetical protein D6785_13615 [Planctomycetota bacterium]